MVIYVVESAEPWATRVTTALTELSPEVIVSDLVRLECRVLPLRNGDDFAIAEFERFFRQNRPIRVGQRVFDVATGLRARTRLATPDALHLASAIQRGCDEFWTNDHRLDRVALPVRVRVFDEQTAMGTIDAPPG